MRDLGNTIVVVEHDEETIRSADYVVDLGPGAGRAGGEILAQGSLPQVECHPTSLTAQYLNGSRAIPVPSQRRRGSGQSIRVVGVRHNNLQNIDVIFPLGSLIAVTGVSGSGKSSLVDGVLYPVLSRRLTQSILEPGRHSSVQGVEHIRQGDRDRSVTYWAYAAIQSGHLYRTFLPRFENSLPCYPSLGCGDINPGAFSFNVKGGRCESCRGEGLRKIEMNFLPDVYVDCDACRGSRYNRETRMVKYNGHSIADVLEMTIEDAFPLFENIPRIHSRLKTLREVGLGYVKLGQSATTLSGGEAQRAKLSRELSKKATGNTLYILDEPTTGLHFDDVRKLLDILNRLVDRGNTVIVIEHNLEVIKCADWIVDLGPEGGQGGGRLVAAGAPEEVARSRSSHTGKALREPVGSQCLVINSSSPNR